jgi:hypothetical protein
MTDYLPGTTGMLTRGDAREPFVVLDDGRYQVTGLFGKPTSAAPRAYAGWDWSVDESTVQRPAPPLPRYRAEVLDDYNYVIVDFQRTYDEHLIYGPLEEAKVEAERLAQLLNAAEAGVSESPRTDALTALVRIRDAWSRIDRLGNRMEDRIEIDQALRDGLGLTQPTAPAPITTREGLLALPEGTVVENRNNYQFTRDLSKTSGFRTPENWNGTSTQYLKFGGTLLYGPYTVVQEVGQ